MSTFNDFSREPVRNSSPDHRGYDDSEHIGQGSFHSTLVAVTRDSVLAPDRSRPSNLQRHHSISYSRSPRRGPAPDVSRSLHTQCGATIVQQSSHEWGPSVGDLDLVPAPGPTQREPPHHFFASVSSNGIYDPAAGSLLPHIHGVTPPISTEYSLRPQGIYPHDFLTSGPNPVSGETSSEQNSGLLVYPPYPPQYEGHIVSTVDQPQPNHTQPSGSGSQGPLLIVDPYHNSLIQHSTFEGGPHNSDLSSSSGRQMTVVPQRSYAKPGDREQGPIIFKVYDEFGIPARDAIERIYAGLEGRDDRVPVDKTVMMLRLEWPGYLPWSSKVRLRNWKKTPEKISLDKLATAVAKCLERFIKAHAGKHPDRECSDWRVGPQFIEIDRLVLVALDNVSRGSWQPRIAVLSG